MLDIVTFGFGMVFLDIGGMRLRQYIGQIGKLVLFSASLSKVHWTFFISATISWTYRTACSGRLTSIM